MITRAERKWAVWFGAGLMLLTTLPYLAGYFAQTSEWRYSGLALAEEDGYSYFAKMLLGANGAWLFRTPYTLMEQNGFLAFLPYLLLGKLTSTPGQHEQIVALFHVMRITGGVLASLATYEFATLFTHEVRWRRWATVLTMAGGGFGWLYMTGLSSLWQGYVPLEFHSPETFGFLGWLAIPHLAWARALLLWGLIAFLRSKDIRAGAVTGLLWLVMGFFQPLVIAVGWAVLGAYLAALALWTWRSPAQDWVAWRTAVLRAVLAGLISSPFVLYNLVSFRMDPFLRLWESQNILTSPPVGDYLLGYLAVLPCLAVGVVAVWKKLDERNLLLLAWLAALPLLAYLPINMQRRLPEGSWAALSVLTILGLAQLAARWRRLALGWLSLGFIPAVVLMVLAYHSATTLAPPSFRPVAEMRAFHYFDRFTGQPPAVLAADETSTALPAYTSARVPIGHGPESIGAEQLRVSVPGFFKPETTDAERLTLLRELGIAYVFWGQAERALGPYDPGELPGLEPVYSEEGYVIYRVDLVQ